MLAYSHDDAVLLPLHDTSEGDEPTADLDDLVLNEDFLSVGDGTEVGDVECAADAEVDPKVGLVDEEDGHGGGEVKQGSGGTAVEVSEAVAVIWLDGEAKCDARLSVGDGVKADVRDEVAHVVASPQRSIFFLRRQVQPPLYLFPGSAIYQGIVILLVRGLVVSAGAIAHDDDAYGFKLGNGADELMRGLGFWVRCERIWSAWKDRGNVSERSGTRRCSAQYSMSMFNGG
jgi:hypothetical protein